MSPETGPGTWNREHPHPALCKTEASDDFGWRRLAQPTRNPGARRSEIQPGGRCGNDRKVSARLASPQRTEYTKFPKGSGKRSSPWTQTHAAVDHRGCGTGNRE